jgi:uncharacterized protein
MKNIPRKAEEIILQKLQPNKVLVLYGPRRTGKTTLLKKICQQIGSSCSLLKGERVEVQEAFGTTNFQKLKEAVGSTKLLILDEAQMIPDIGKALKILVDESEGLQIIASGSASFELAQKVGEPLTGRKKTIRLYSLAASEIIQHTSLITYKAQLEQLLIYGSYPECYTLKGYDAKKEYLEELADAYLFKDILELDKVLNPKKLRDLLTLLAFQIGNEVSLNELANALQLHSDTVARYLDLLEKAFIIINIRGFSRNLRKEVSKTSRYYFYDNGIRNALIRNFNPIALRNDIGMLWENYVVMERIKRQHYSGVNANNYFWRTYDKKEIDWVEERDGELYGYEIKWGNKKVKPPKGWLETYENAHFEVVNKESHLSFIGD